MKFINPRTDFAFKRIFGSEKSKNILMSFLNSILELKGENEIKKVNILDPYQAPKIEGLKETYLDLKVETEGGKKIIIEMQVLSVKGFDKRVLYNLTKSYSNQIEKGEHYLKLRPVIALTITDFVMFDKYEKYISNYFFKEKDNNDIYNGDLEMVFVELPKFKNTLEELKDIKEKWIYFMKEVDDLEVEPEIFKKDKIFKEAFELANKINLSKEELDILERQSIYIQDKRGMIQKGYEDGLDKGLKDGMEKGLKDGMEKGMEKGEKKKENELVQNLMKSMNIDEKQAKSILGI